MKKIVLVVIAFLSIGICDMYSQVIKMEHGANLTWMDGGGLTKKNLSYSFMIGCDYLENDWMMLSSEIGYIKRSGRENWQFDRDYNSDGSIKEQYFRRMADLNYIQINTTFRFKHDFKRATIFMGVGPTIDFLLGDKSEWQICPVNSDKTTTNKGTIHHSNVLYGLKYELGVNYHINSKWDAILNVNHLNSFKCSTIGHYNGESFHNKTVSISLGIGYRI